MWHNITGGGKNRWNELIHPQIGKTDLAMFVPIVIGTTGHRELVPQHIAMIEHRVEEFLKEILIQDASHHSVSCRLMRRGRIVWLSV